MQVMEIPAAGWMEVINQRKKAPSLCQGLVKQSYFVKQQPVLATYAPPFFLPNYPLALLAAMAERASPQPPGPQRGTALQTAWRPIALWRASCAASWLDESSCALVYWVNRVLGHAQEMARAREGTSFYS